MARMYDGWRSTKSTCSLLDVSAITVGVEAVASTELSELAAMDGVEKVFVAFSVDERGVQKVRLAAV